MWSASAVCLLSSGQSWLSWFSPSSVNNLTQNMNVGSSKTGAFSTINSKWPASNVFVSVVTCIFILLQVVQSASAKVLIFSQLQNNIRLSLIRLKTKEIWHNYRILCTYIHFNVLIYNRTYFVNTWIYVYICVLGPKDICRICQRIQFNSLMK